MEAASIWAAFGFKVDQASIDREQKSIENFVAGARRTLTGLGLGLGAMGLAKTLISAGDEYTNLHSRLGLVASSQEEVNALWEKLRVIARNTRADLAGTVSGFVKIAQSVKGL